MFPPKNKTHFARAEQRRNIINRSRLFSLKRAMVLKTWKIHAQSYNCNWEIYPRVCQVICNNENSRRANVQPFWSNCSLFSISLSRQMSIGLLTLADRLLTLAEKAVNNLPVLFWLLPTFKSLSILCNLITAANEVGSIVCMFVCVSVSRISLLQSNQPISL